MERDMIGVYMIQNKINGKIYVGQSIDIKRRWRNHKNSYKKENSCFYCAIRKHGIENFSFSVLEECEISELSYLERKYIKLYHSNCHNFGYNMEYGGNVGGHRSPETIKKIKETKAKNPYIYTDEDKRKISEASKNRHINKLPKIVCLETGEIKENVEWCKTSKMITEVAKGKYKQYKGLHFEFVEKENRKIKCLETGEICSENEWYKKGYSLAGQVAKSKITDTKNKHFIYVNESCYKIKLARCLETGEVYSLSDWSKKGYFNVGLVCRGKRKSCGGKHFERVK